LDSARHVLELRDVERFRPFETALGGHLKHRLDPPGLSRLPSVTKIIPGKPSRLLLNTLAPRASPSLCRQSTPRIRSEIEASEQASQEVRSLLLALDCNAIAARQLQHADEKQTLQVRRADADVDPKRA